MPIYGWKFTITYLKQKCLYHLIVFSSRYAVTSKYLVVSLGESDHVTLGESDHVTRILRSYLDLVFLSSSSTLVCSNPGWFRRWFRAGGDYRNHIILAEYAGVWKLLEVWGSYPVGQAWWKKKAPAALACCAENIVVIEQWTKPLILVIVNCCIC